MANKVTNEDILRINEIYYKTKVYAETARQTGFSASTVKKYVVHGWEPVLEVKIIHFDTSLLPNYKEAAKAFRGIDNYGELCVLSEKEEEEIKELWKELSI